MFWRHADIQNLSKYRNQIYGFCSIWIMLFHGAVMERVHLDESVPVLNLLLSYGNCAVDIFLFLAGIGCFFSYSKLRNYDAFMKARLRRVAVPYLLWGAIIWPIVDIYMKGLGLKQVLWDLSLYSFWKTGEQLFWYVAIILFVYILYPLIYKSAFEFEEGKYKFFVFFLWMAGVLAVNAYCKNSYPEVYDNIEIAICRIPVFLCGCIAGEYVFYKKNFCRSIYIAAFVLTGLSGLICKTKYFPLIGFRYTYLFIGVAICLTLSVLFSIISTKMKWICKVLGFLGTISLELYIVHIALRRLFMKSPLYVEDCFMRYCVLMLFAIGIATLLHYGSDALRRVLGYMSRKKPERNV